MFNDPQQQEIHDFFKLFELGCYSDDGYCPLWPLFKSPESTNLLREKAISLGGKISVSHFIIAFNQLRESGEIRQLRQPKADEIETPELTVEDYRKMPTRTVVMKYQSDKVFKSQVDSLVARGLI
jgi:hypothetical protein